MKKRIRGLPVGDVEGGWLVVDLLVGVVLVEHHGDGELALTLARFQQQGDCDNIVDFGDEITILFTG